MNDEIREILENIKRQNEWDGIEYFKTPLSTKDANKLLDYITNLQKENEAKEKVIKKQDYVINELEKYIRNYINLMVNNPDIIEQGQLDILYEVLDKLKELKEKK